MFVALIPACNILSEGDPEHARVILVATTPGQQVVLIVSNDFDVDRSPGENASQIFFRTADTLLVTPPFEQRFALGSRLRFFASASAPDTLDQLIDLTVFIDGDERFSQSRPVGVGTPMEFLYVFAQPTI